MTNWHTLDTATALSELDSEPAQGLSGSEVEARLQQYGPNELIDRGGKSPWLILWEQFSAVLIVMLIIAAIASAFLGDIEDTIAIVTIVILNGILGFRQEYRAEKAMAALKKLAVPKVKVRRDGSLKEISARDLVPGDIVLLEQGNLVPADCRLLEAINLRTQEAALTGESEPIDKTSEPISGDQLPLGDRRNMAYMGTIVAYGRGSALITATGMGTELGHIATMIQSAERQATPLQRRLDQLGKKLVIAAALLVSIIFAEGLLTGEGIELMLLTSISIAVAAVPEGLPAVVTIALALGAQRMLKRQALIRKLPAVETLGSVTVICSDKTGTLTENRMTVTVLDIAGHRVDLTQELRAPETAAKDDNNESDLISSQPSLALLLAGGSLCSDAVVEYDGDEVGRMRVVGEPTEGALVMAATRQGLWKGALEGALPRLAEAPFDSTRKRMTTLHEVPADESALPDTLEAIWRERKIFTGAKYVSFTKGAIDSLLGIATEIWTENHREPLTDDWQRRIMAAHDKLAQDGMRILAIGFRAFENKPDDTSEEALEQQLVLVGLIGMMDPARPEVKESVRECKSAGIRPVMITGDHPLTAGHIARELGISENDTIVTGSDLTTTPDKLENVENISVFARVSPEHKLDIVSALQERGHLVAMTGDGVNDAPALKKADIGVAMGITGTDVAKEAADVVLQDDNFATIVSAVREGRVIYDNIRKFIIYLLAGNVGELLVMLITPLFGMPLALMPIQILWINLVTDGLPALALGVEPAESNVMKRPPYPPREGIFARGVGVDILWLGMIVGISSLGLGYFYWLKDLPQWQTMIFCTLTFAQMAHAFTAKSFTESAFRINPLANKSLTGAVLLTFVLQIGIIYLPVLQGFFDTVPLTGWDMLISISLGSAVFWGYEIKKFIQRRRS